MRASARASPRCRSLPSRRRARPRRADARRRNHPRIPAMAMNVAAPSRSSDPDVMIDINTTPLIDVMLVLLVMLIITIPIQLHAVNLEMPVGTPPTSDIKPEKVQIDIDDRSVVYWQGLPVTAAELDEKMNILAQLNPQPEV